MTAPQDQIKIGSQSGFWRFYAGLFTATRSVQLRYDGLEFTSRRRSWTLAYSDIAGLKLSRGILAATITVTTNTATLKLRGLDKQLAKGFYAAARAQWVDSLKQRLDQWQDQYGQSIAFVDSLSNPLRYVRQSHITRHTRTISNGLALLPQQLPAELETHRVNQERPALECFIAEPAPLAVEANKIFVIQEKQRSKGLFETIESNPLSDEQQAAVVTDEDHNLVVAAAGSGKTAVIVAKLAHILTQGDIRPAEILVLAFNRTARDELRERIAEKIDSPSVQEAAVMTFHGLGYSIIGATTNRKPSLAKHADATWKAAQYIRKIIEDLCVDEDFEQLLIDWFDWHLHQYKSAFEFESLGEYCEYLEENEVVTLKGEKVRSHEEFMIANFLHLNGIDYEYEAKYEVDTADAEHRRYEPDFYLSKHGIYIEHFGIDRNGRTAPFVNAEQYRIDMEWKRNLHQTHETVLIETYSYQKPEGTLLSSLRTALEARGIVLAPVSTKERLDQLRKSTTYDRFSELIAVFLSHFKSNDFDKPRILDRAANFSDSDRAYAFINVFWPIYEKYQAEMVSANEVDFESMIQDATAMVKAGNYQSPFRYILVDEFQDISVGRAKLIEALCEQNYESQMFAVGDDWQSIYRFAGSDISVMRHFDQYFGPTARSDLSTTYRCNQELVDVSAKFISANPAQLSKRVRGVRNRNDKAVYIGRTSKDLPDPLHESLRRIRREAPSANVLVLGRYRHNSPDNWDELKKTFDSLTLRFRTVHSAKGLESDYAVILGLSAGMYGFPSEIEDDPLLDLVLAEQEPFAHAEERRLFYVAVTRAKHAVFLIAPEVRCSHFIKELEKPGYSIERFGAEPAARTHCPTCKTGLLRLRSGKNGNFVACTNYPRCSYTSNTCPRCHNGIVKIVDERGICEACNEEVEACPRCADGFLVLRKGKFGNFWGCSSYPKCRYTKSTA